MQRALPAAAGHDPALSTEARETFGQPRQHKIATGEITAGDELLFVTAQISLELWVACKYEHKDSRLRGLSTLLYKT